jgi:hypothetical protein
MERRLVRGVALLFVLLLAGCSGGEAGRWIGAENKIVSVENKPYQVSWLRDASGIDMRAHRSRPSSSCPIL